MKTINLKKEKLFVNNNLGLIQEKLELFLVYEELLIKWNKVHNLLSKASLPHILTHHFLDSLSILPYIKGDYVLDVGTGAGFPGLPLAIVSPRLKVHLLDNNQKKLSFLLQLKDKLNLKNITVVNADVRKYKSEKKFNTIVSRAFSKLSDFYMFSNHLCCEGGNFYAMKGKINKSEISLLTKNIKNVVELNVPLLNKTRHLIILKKTNENYSYN